MNTPTPAASAPAPDGETAAYWEAAAAGRLLIRHCEACRRSFFYPRAGCPLCGSRDTRWQAASGMARLYSFSVMRRGAEPYCLAYATLDEGPTLMTNLVEADFDAIRIGMRLRVRFQPGPDGQTLPCFAPAEPLATQGQSVPVANPEGDSRPATTTPGD